MVQFVAGVAPTALDPHAPSFVRQESLIIQQNAKREDPILLDPNM